MENDNEPTLTKEGEEWIVGVHRSSSFRTKDLNLAHLAFEMATWSYRNGAKDALKKVRNSLGLGE